MPAMVDALVEHRGLEQLHGGAHADKALAVFLERQLDAFLVALRVEGLDECTVIGDALRPYSTLISASRLMIALKLIALPGVVSSKPASRQVR